MNRLLLLSITSLLVVFGQPAFAKESTKELIAELGSTNKQTRSIAARKLVILSAAAVPDLIEGMGDPNEKIQQACTGLLIKLKARAVPGLISKGLTHKKRKVGKSSIIALIAIGPPALAQLKIATKHPSPSISKASQVIIKKITDRMSAPPENDKKLDPNNQVKALISKFNAKNQKTRLGAAFKVSKLGAVAVNPLIEALDSEEDSVRTMASLALSQMGTVASPAAKTLIAHFGDSVIPVRKSCANAIVKIGAPAQALLIEGTASLEVEIRQWSCYSLGRIKGNREDSVRAIAKRIDDESKFVRGQACLAICRLGFKGILNQTSFIAVPQAVPNFTAAMNNTNPFVRANAALALLYYGKTARRSAMVVANHLGDINQTVQKLCITILANLGSDATKVVLKSLTHKNPKIRKNASVAAGRMSSEAAVLLPALKKLQNDKVLAVANAAKVAVLRLKSAGKKDDKLP